MKDSIIGIDPETGRVVCLTENTQSERERCASEGLDVITVNAADVGNIYKKNVTIELSSIIENDKSIPFLIKIIADIRGATGVNEKPMLTELAEAIKDKFDELMKDKERKEYLYAHKHEFWLYKGMWRFMCFHQNKTFVDKEQDICVDHAIAAMNKGEKDE